jgi:anti-sigma regulatory factor (Ser/Thr protein kinase)
MSRNLSECRNIRSYLSPQSTFNGDILLSAPKPYGGLYVFLGDLTGHGLGAAIGSIPLSQVFFAMTAKGKPVASIIQEMNRSLRNFLPRSMFCAAGIMELDASGRRASLWLGGLPSSFHIGRDGSVRAEISSSHVPLGILDQKDFNAELTYIDLDEGDSLLFMTDGLNESHNALGEMFGDERVGEVLRGETSKSAFEDLLSARNSFAGDSAQDDDISLVQVLALPPEPPSAYEQASAAMLPWVTTISLDAEELKALADPVAVILRLIPESVALAVYYDRISTVLTELFSNALEHGLLGLSSSMKNTADGFVEYYQEREKRLRQLDRASIQISFSYNVLSEPACLTISVKDSGEGFDLSALSFAELEQSHGRGMALVQSLCSRLEYKGKGNEVIADISLSENSDHSA